MNRLCIQDAIPSALEQELVTAVRKELTIALRDLLQHGLMEVGWLICECTHMDFCQQQSILNSQHFVSKYR